MNEQIPKVRFVFLCGVLAIGLLGCRNDAVEPQVVIPTPGLTIVARESPGSQDTQLPEPVRLATSTPSDGEDESTHEPDQAVNPTAGAVELIGTEQNESEKQPIYHVSFVAEDDVLNVRRSAGVDSPINFTLAPSGGEIAITGDGITVGNSLWVPVESAGKSGWVNSRYLVEELDPSEFCQVEAVQRLVDRLKLALETRDDLALAALVENGRGLRIRRNWWNPEVLLEQEDIVRIFSSDEVFDWGIADGSGQPINGSFRTTILPLLEEDFLAASEVGCNDILHAGTAGLVQLPAAYEGINYLSFFRPAGPNDNELDWGSWVVGIEKWHGEFWLSFLVHYDWEI